MVDKIESIKCNGCGSAHVRYGIKSQYYVICDSCGVEEEVTLDTIAVAVSAVGASLIFGFLKNIIRKLAPNAFKD